MLSYLTLIIKHPKQPTKEEAEIQETLGNKEDYFARKKAEFTTSESQND